MYHVIKIDDCYCFACFSFYCVRYFHDHSSTERQFLCFGKSLNGHLALVWTRVGFCFYPGLPLKAFTTISSLQRIIWKHDKKNCHIVNWNTFVYFVNWNKMSRQHGCCLFIARKIGGQWGTPWLSSDEINVTHYQMMLMTTCWWSCSARSSGGLLCGRHICKELWFIIYVLANCSEKYRSKIFGLIIRIIQMTEKEQGQL